MGGRGGEVKEYSIAIEALGRGTEFDPRLDPIVRTQARKLRARLTAYYETEGRSDAIRIELRKGSYAPRFYYAEPAVSSPPQVPVAAIVPGGLPAAGSHRRRAMVAGAAIVALCAGAVFYLGRYQMQEPGSLTVTALVNASGDPGAQVLEDRLSASLISSLRQRGLKVVSQGARAVLTGKFVKAGTKLRIKVQLSYAAHSSHFWSGSYEGDIGEIQIVVREITEDVSDMLRHP
jgi:TolB-like protein